MRGRPKVEIDEREFVADWEAGVTLAVMSEKYGLSRGTLSVKAKTMGLKPRKAGRPRKNKPGPPPPIGG